MKKILFLVFALMILSYASVGQNRFGLKAGLNLANQGKTVSIPQTTATTLNTKPYVGYQVGGFYKTNLNRQFSFAAEANFSVIGSGMTLMTPDGKSHKAAEKLGYIELPLTLQYSIDRLYFGLGPSVGFKMFSKLKGVENRTADIPYYRTLDAAGTILAGYQVSGNLDVNVRYNHGLINILKDPGYAMTKNKFFNLSFLYALK